MSEITHTARKAVAGAPAAAREHARGGLSFDLAVAVLSSWVMIGLYIDGWAHNNLPGIMETFFTPWHAVLYSGYLALAAFHFWHLTRNVRRGHRLSQAMPLGYGLSIVGVMLFGFGGFFDMLWHGWFGFEEDVEALLSPAHMLLAAGAVLYVAGPLRAGWRRSAAETPPGWRGILPAWLAIFQLLAVFTFFTQYAHFLTWPQNLIQRPASGVFYRDLWGVTSVIIPAALLMGLTLLALRRWRLPPGALALMWGGNSLMMAVMGYGHALEHPWLLGAVVLAGILADALLQALKPSSARPGAMRLFAFGAPFLFFLVYFAALVLSAGTWWSIHMWLGAALQGGLVGLFLSFLVFPPAN
jgi:hypothetical protein